ncbi:uncharacterized protein LOC134793270 [Cydia splendana]|uniref:uncharacterized protein LOC134793270 n=1 Tax=Cydia splendana TaxID=1100963 RepID=UPI0028F46607
MGLLRITSVLILVLQVFGARGDHLPLLPGNRLRTGDAAEYPGATLIDCVKGNRILSDFQRSHTYTPTQALVNTNNFERYPFTSHAVIPGILVDGGIGRFSFVKLTHGILHKRTAFALQTSADGEYAYWMPQGRYVDVPQHPSANQPHFVFTPDYSGCAWTVTPMTNGMLRLKHVEGGHQDRQFNNLPPWHKGGEVSYGMQFRDYGYVHRNGRLIKHATAYAYMHYSDVTRRWKLHVQHQTCAPRPGNTAYDHGQIVSMKMNYFNQKTWNPITGTEFWVIPSGRPASPMRLQRRS